MSKISTFDFIKILCGDSDFDIIKAEKLRLVGILEEYDIMNRGEFIDRKSAARITHEYMLKELKIKDLQDISRAAVLRDLYDCRVCVNHIAQVYLQGVMDAKTVPGLSDREFIFFDSKSDLEYEEAVTLKKRLCKLF